MRLGPRKLALLLFLGAIGVGFVLFIAPKMLPGADREVPVKRTPGKTY